MGLIADGAILQNEVKAWPPLLPDNTDLVTQNHWWDTVGTPTTEATVVLAAGEAGLEEKFERAIKCVTDAANEGFKQRYTYADEPRIKSGAVISALVWVAHASGVASCDVTVKLVNSDASETVGAVIASTTDWECHLVEGHSCAGTYVDLQVTKDTSGTFYAGGPITVMVGASAIGLPPRGLRYVHIAATTVKTLTGLADEATWTDVDVTASSSNLAVIAQLNSFFLDSTSGDVFALHVRRNGSSEAASADTARGKVQVTSQIASVNFPIVLDDVQIFEYFFDREGGTGTLEFGVITLIGYWEWE